MKLFSLALAILLSFVACKPQAQRAVPSEPPKAPVSVVSQLNTAVFELYSEDDSGRTFPVCTATAFQVIDNVYYLLTAAHCLLDIEPNQETVHRQSFFIRIDHDGNIRLIRAKIFAVGCVRTGDDFGVLTVRTLEPLSTIPIGHDPIEVGENVINMAAPLGRGVQLFRGHVTKLVIDRSVTGKLFDWRGFMMLAIPETAPGSSGSAIICEQQRAICGVLVGITNNNKITVAAPMSRFGKWFLKAITNK